MKSEIKKRRSVTAGIVRSRVGWFLVAIHAILFVVALGQKQPMSRQQVEIREKIFSNSDVDLLAGRSFHFHYESPLTKTVVLVDSPSLIASVPFAILADGCGKLLHIDSYAMSYAGAALWLLVASFQWQLAGAWLQLRVTRSRRTITQLPDHSIPQ
jgi:hypothetical protein